MGQAAQPRRFLSAISIIGLALGYSQIVVPVPAQAQESGPENVLYWGETWQLSAVSAPSDIERSLGLIVHYRPPPRKCVFILNHGAFGINKLGDTANSGLNSRSALKAPKSRLGGEIRWDGDCDKEGFITGYGTLSFDMHNDAYQEFTVGKNHKLSARKFTGNAAKGIFHGPVTFGYMFKDFWGNTNIELQNKQNINFVNGCNDWNKLWPDTCKPSEGAAIRDKYLAEKGGSASYKPANNASYAPGPGNQNSTASATNPATPKPIAVTPLPAQKPVQKATPPVAPAVARAPATDTLYQQQSAVISAKQKAEKDAADAYARDVARIKAENAKAQALYAQQQADYRAAVAAQQAEAARVRAANAAAQAKYQADLAKAEACRKGDKTKCT